MYIYRYTYISIAIEEREQLDSARPPIDTAISPRHSKISTPGFGGGSFGQIYTGIYTYINTFINIH